MILWISIILLSVGFLIIIGDWIMAYLSTKREGGYTFVPFFAGIFLFIGTMLIPVNLPLPRLLAAFLAMCLDFTISWMLPMMIWDWLRTKTRKN